MGNCSESIKTNQEDIDIYQEISTVHPCCTQSSGWVPKHSVKSSLLQLAKSGDKTQQWISSGQLDKESLTWRKIYFRSGFPECLSFRRRRNGTYSLLTRVHSPFVAGTLSEALAYAHAVLPALRLLKLRFGLFAFTSSLLQLEQNRPVIWICPNFAEDIPLFKLPPWAEQAMINSFLSALNLKRISHETWLKLADSTLAELEAKIEQILHYGLDLDNSDHRGPPLSDEKGGLCIATERSWACGFTPTDPDQLLIDLISQDNHLS